MKLAGDHGVDHLNVWSRKLALHSTNGCINKEPASGCIALSPTFSSDNMLQTAASASYTEEGPVLDQLIAQLRSLREKEKKLEVELEETRLAAALAQSQFDEFVADNNISFVDRLPNEIFAAVLEDVCYLDGSRITTFDFLEWLRASHRWRDTIMKTPSLWSTIDITEKFTPDTLEAFLDRSGKMPLHITLRPSKSSVDLEAQQTVLSLMEKLAVHSSRWCDLDIHEFDDRVMPSLLSLLDRETSSSLERLSIQNSLAFPYPKFVSPAGCPNLQSLELIYFPPLDTIPTAHLTFLHVESPYYGSERQLCDALLSARHLSHLVLDCPLKLFEDMDLKPDSIHLPQLSSLSISISQARRHRGLEVLFKSLSAPGLTNLECVNYTPLDRGDLLTWDTFISRGNPRFPLVCSIRIRDLIAEDTDSLNVAKAFPLVRDCSLWSDDLDIFLHSEAIDLWEDLESLTVHKSIDPSDLSGLLRWLRRRQTLGKPPVAVKFHGPDYGSDDLRNYDKLARCAPVELRGVKVHLPEMFISTSPSPSIEFSETVNCTELIEMVGRAIVSGQVTYGSDYY
ncbi:hypothetical protein HYDPIDRAFT_33557 [Hydnomerulius pinastri MD-312]|uniref:F-box domain-containing protein n=1 Tax=Hydnomerulius pinastri MD-312 TaxID=994086 RepID=A0A0C9VN04_9AGAM|nr:hypothetical protein HYDPIDRAFT_33557 [Hydnomerulius pinastri MD-312]